MHLQRVLRNVCLLRITKHNLDADTTGDLYCNPKKFNAFAGLHFVYISAKNCVDSYGNVRVWNAETIHRPHGYEHDPRSCMFVCYVCFRLFFRLHIDTAVYVMTPKRKVLCTFVMLQSVVATAIQEASTIMNTLRVPAFGADQLSQVQDYDMSTPGQGIETMNAHLWGKNPQESLLAILQQFAGSKTKVQVLFYLFPRSCFTNVLVPGATGVEGVH
jgi:hypothetical protein